MALPSDTQTVYREQHDDREHGMAQQWNGAALARLRSPVLTALDTRASGPSVRDSTQLPLVRERKTSGQFPMIDPGTACKKVSDALCYETPGTSGGRMPLGRRLLSLQLQHALQQDVRLHNQMTPDAHQSGDCRKKTG